MRCKDVCWLLLETVSLRSSRISLHISYSIVPSRTLWFNDLCKEATHDYMTDRVIEEALSLPADARLSLVEKLLTSLNLPIDTEIDSLWAEEAERRIDRLESGEAKLIPGEEVFSKIRAKHGL